MAKATTQAKRVFFVRLNTDDLALHMEYVNTDVQARDFLTGCVKGSRGIDLEPELLETSPPLFRRGYAFGRDAYTEARECFGKAQEAGKKSAEARKAKNGTSQPNGGKGSMKSRGYEDPRWQVLRLRTMERDGFKCSKCGNGERTLHVHHLKYTVGAQAWESPMEDLTTLCEVCHSDTHKK
jgi:hypothetical protein